MDDHPWHPSTNNHPGVQSALIRLGYAVGETTAASDALARQIGLTFLGLNFIHNITPAAAIAFMDHLATVHAHFKNEDETNQ